MKKIIVVSLACLSMFGCVSSHVLIGTVRPEIDPSQVRIYSQPPTGFEEVAILTASSKSSWAWTEQGKTDVVIEGFKKEAAALGANGVLIQGLSTQQGDAVGISSGNTYGNTYGNNTYAYGTGTTVYASDTYRSGQALAIYVHSARDSIQTSLRPDQGATKTTSKGGSRLRAVSADDKDGCNFITSITRGKGGSGDVSKYIESAMDAALAEAAKSGADSYFVVNTDTTSSGATVVLEAFKCE